MGARKKIADEVFLKLAEMSDEAYKHGHYIQSAITGFQLVELFLRVVVNTFAVRNASSKDIMEKLEDEQKFVNLVVFLGLVKPDNGISKKLFDFNAKRNKIVHRLFYGDSLASIESTLKELCKESLELVGGLRSLIHSR